MPKKTNLRRVSAMLVLSMILQMVPAIPVFGAVWAPVTEQPVTVVTGTAITGIPTADGVNKEKAYTLTELNALSNLEVSLYSSLNSAGTKRIYKVKGLYLDELFKNTAFVQTEYDKNKVTLIAADGMTATFDPNHTANTAGGNTAGGPPVSKGLDAKRYYYPNVDKGEATGAVENRPMLSLSLKYESAPNVPTDGSLEIDNAAPRLVVGQLDVTDVNSPMYNQSVQKIIAGSEHDKVINITGMAYTRADILLKPRLNGDYTYQTKGGERVETVQGVPLVTLLGAYGDTDEVEFISADGYENDRVTIAQIKDDANKYLLAYAKNDGTGNLTGIFDTAKDNGAIVGYFSVYSTGNQPVKMVSEIKVHTNGEDYSNSPFKHRQLYICLHKIRIDLCILVGIIV